MNLLLLKQNVVLGHKKISGKSFSNPVHSSLLQSVQGEASTAWQVGLSLLQSSSTLYFPDEKAFM